MTELYPLLTERKIVQPIWGGNILSEWLGMSEPRPERLGETWQVYDTNPIVNGALAGRALADVVKEFGAALVGTRTAERYGADFPLLAKFIDAADKLSIQVHPDDSYAHTREAATGFHGKTEAWYILQAAPGADVVYGMEHATSRDEFAAAVTDNNVDALMHRVPVAAGDVVFVPAGTVHAINAGIVLFEIQQKSDLTYRVYDYDRRDAKTGQPRELHLDKSLDVLDYHAVTRGALAPLPFEPGRDLLIACPYFALERWTLGDSKIAATDPGSFEIFTVIEGDATLRWDSGEVALQRGDSVVLPATLGSYTVQPQSNDVQLLRAYVPDLDRDLRVPLREKGVDETRIAESVIG